MYTNKGSKPAAKAPNKLWHAIKHKNLDVFKLDLVAEEDQNYVSASERFLELQTQLGMVLHHTTLFRKSLEESLQQAVELADDFGRVSSGQGAGRAPEPWASTAGKQAFYLKGMLEESVESLRQHLNVELEEKMVRSLRDEVIAFSTVQNQMNERANMKVEMLHYAKKLEVFRGGKGNQKNIDEKMDRNKEKYAQASQALRDQTNQLMSVFAHAEQLRQKLLTQDLPSVISSKRSVFEAFSVNLNKASADTLVDDGRSRMPPAAQVSNRSIYSGNGSPQPPHGRLAEISLQDTSSPGQAYTSIPMKMEPPPPYDAQQTIVKKRSPTPMSPKEGSGAPWAGSANGGGEFAEELKRAHEHQNSKMAAESATANTGAAAATSAASSASAPNTGGTPERTREASTPVSAKAGGSRGSSPAGSPGPQPPGAGEVDDSATAGAGSKDSEDGDDASDKANEDDGLDELPPGKVRVRALYDYDATQDGDLSFSAGDIIITDKGAFSGDGWVSGDCHGKTGIFPANYTEPW